MAKTGACRTAILPEISGHQLKSALSELRVCLPSEREEYAWTCKMTGEVQHDPSMRSSQGNLTFPEHKARNDLCCEMVPPDTLHSFLLSSNLTIPELLMSPSCLPLVRVTGDITADVLNIRVATKARRPTRPRGCKFQKTPLQEIQHENCRWYSETQAIANQGWMLLGRLTSPISSATILLY